MKIIRHGKLPISLISDDPLTLDMLDTISVSMVNGLILTKKIKIS